MGIINGSGISNTGNMTVKNSTISSNTASGGDGGGGIFNLDGDMTVMNSTISGNRASSGGGIYNEGADSSRIANTALIFCTIMNNSTPGQDGFDIANSSDMYAAPFSHISMKASIVGGNDTQHTPIVG